MITRLTLSLKEASASQEYGWSPGVPIVHTTMRFAEYRDGISTGDEIHLYTFRSTREETQE